MKHFILLQLVCWLNAAQAQDPSTASLRWSLGQGKDLRTNDSFTYSGTLNTAANHSIQWIQANASSTFTVTSVSGAWTDISHIGQLVFSVEEDGASGLLTFERNTNGLFVTMEFPKDDPQGSRVRWVVTAVINNN